MHPRLAAAGAAPQRRSPSARCAQRPPAPAPAAPCQTGWQRPPGRGPRCCRWGRCARCAATATGGAGAGTGRRAGSRHSVKQAGFLSFGQRGSRPPPAAPAPWQLQKAQSLPQQQPKQASGRRGACKPPQHRGPHLHAALDGGQVPDDHEGEDEGDADLAGGEERRDSGRGRRSSELGRGRGEGGQRAQRAQQRSRRGRGRGSRRSSKPQAQAGGARAGRGAR